MDVKKYLQVQIAGVRKVTDGVIGDLTNDLLNWMPPGTANPIRSTFAHFLGSEDRFIHTVIQGKPTIFESQGWAEKLGVSMLPRRGANWELYRDRAISLDVLLAYQEVVRAATAAFLETLTEEELDRKVDFHGEERLVAEMLALLVTHNTQHVGEIAALKGVQGAQGLPY